MIANCERRLIKALKSTGRRRFATANRRFFDDLLRDYVRAPVTYQPAAGATDRYPKLRADMHC
jgi:hypothetical protein